MTHVLGNEDLVAEVFESLDFATQIFIESVSRCFRRACLRSWSRRFSNLPTVFNAYARIESKQRHLLSAHVHAARLGSVAYLEWLECFVPFFQSWKLGNDFVEACCRVGNDRVVDWLGAKGFESEQQRYNYLSECIKQGNVAAFGALYTTDLLYINKFMLVRLALERGCWDIVDTVDFSSAKRVASNSFEHHLYDDVDLLIGLYPAIQARDDSVPDFIRRLHRPDASVVVSMLIHGPDVRWGIEMIQQCLPQRMMLSAAHLAFTVERERGRDPAEFLRWYVGHHWAIKDNDIVLDALLESRVDKALLDQVIDLPAPFEEAELDTTTAELYTTAFCQLYDSDRIWALEHYIRKLSDDSADGNDATLTRIGSFLARRLSKQGFAILLARCNDVHLLENFASPDRGILTPDDFPVTLAYNALRDCRWDILFWMFCHRPDRSYLTDDSMRAPYMVFLACKSHGS